MAKTNETLEEMIKALHSDVREWKDESRSSLEKIEKQTQKTNGRVSNLEMWKAKVSGALLVTDILLIPITIAIVIGYITR